MTDSPPSGTPHSGGSTTGAERGDPPPLDLTPRPVEPGAERARSAQVRNRIIGGVVVLALAFVLFQGLTNARVFFLNVDEAVAQRTELGDRTFRMQGTVVDDEGRESDGAMVFTVAFNNRSAEVRHVGPEPTELFELGEQVVVEGRWQGDVFESHQILVKHDESYVEDNPGRVDPSST